LNDIAAPLVKREGRLFFGLGLALFVRPCRTDCRAHSARRVRQPVAKSRHVSSFAWPVFFISCHSRPQSRMRARDAAGSEGNTGSLWREESPLDGLAGAAALGGAIEVSGAACSLVVAGEAEPGRRAAPRPLGEDGVGDDCAGVCSRNVGSVGRGGGSGATRSF
jgi:hypothetical protein